MNRSRRVKAASVFALLALLVELTGRTLTSRLDSAFNIAPLATPTTSYYPLLLAALRAAAALVVAVVVWRALRAHAAAAAAERLFGRIGHRPRLRLTLSPRLWAYSFAATSLWFLVQDDAMRLSTGRWPLLAPWLHTYALPVFAICSLLLAVGWGAVRSWVDDVERYTATTLEHASRFLRAAAPRVRHRLAGDDRAPRRLYGIVFESRPPPLPV